MYPANFNNVYVQPQQPQQPYQAYANQNVNTSYVSSPVKTNQQVMPAGYAPLDSKTSQIYSQLSRKLLQMHVNQAQGVKLTPATAPVKWTNNLRDMFRENKAIIYAMIPRTFNAKDTDGNGLIEGNEQRGTFINAVEKLDYLKNLGINTLHVLPPNPTGKMKAMGTAGSLYSADDLIEIDPNLKDPRVPGTAKDHFKIFVNECHKRGIAVMIDLPSCASLDLYKKRPDLMAIDSKGYPKVPQGWEDIRMFEPWADKDKRILNKALLDYHKQYVDMCIDVGIDGIRADVGRAKPIEFWDQLIPYARNKNPQFAFLAECYTYEDASPMLNMPADRPEECLKAGFDSYYGQYHIFHEWGTSKDFHDNMILNLEMSQRHERGKSLIGSFATHDDKSPMANGGAPYCDMTTGLQMTLPMTNPYFVTGFESGDRYIYPYKDKISPTTQTDCHRYIVHSEKIDIFNPSRAPGGQNPEIGQYMYEMAKVRQQYEDVITKGSYIPLKVKEGTGENTRIIAYARHLNGKTLLAIANKEVNFNEQGTVVVPGLKSGQMLKDLSPGYGERSKIIAVENGVRVDLGPAKFHLFEIDTPSIEYQAEKVYRQNI